MRARSEGNLRQPVRVTALDGTMAWVESLPRQDCPRCAAGEGCGGGIFTRLFGNKRYRLKMPAGDGLTVGSIVYLEVPERSVTQAAALVYLVPLLLAFVGSLLGHLGDGQGEEAGAIMGALAGFFVGVVGAREMARRWSRWSEWRLVAAEDQDAVVCRWPASR